MTGRDEVSVCIIYPVDPLGVVPGGIESFVRGILRWAPDDIQFQVIGVTTDPVSRPLNRWMKCNIANRSFDFCPIVEFINSSKQAKIPLTVRFLFALRKLRHEVQADVIEFHRIEPGMLFLKDKTPKNIFFHQDMEVIRNPHSDIRWKYWPSLYFVLERSVIKSVNSLFCVREDAAALYREKYPEMQKEIFFTPTWMDTDNFGPATGAQRKQLRSIMTREYEIPADSQIVVSVGRLDNQKNPALLVEAFRLLADSNSKARLLMVGDGVLGQALRDLIRKHRLEHLVRMCGVRPAGEISTMLQSADLFALSSAYEGMPISVLEALSCGLPVVSTDVGEVSRVVRNGVNGQLVAQHVPESFAAAMMLCLQNSARYRGEPCSSAVADFDPRSVLTPIYQNYRNLTRAMIS